MMIIEKFKAGKRYFYANSSEKYILDKLNYERFKGNLNTDNKFYDVSSIKKLLGIIIKCDLVNNSGIYVEVKSTMDKSAWDRDDFCISKNEAETCDFIAYVYMSQIKIKDSIIDIYIPKFYKKISLNYEFLDTITYQQKSSLKVFKKLVRCDVVDILKMNKKNIFSKEQIDILSDGIYK